MSASYRAWFWFYRRNQIARHWLGIHQKPRTYSIAPRCDWCGHRSRRQREIARRNRDALSLPTTSRAAEEER